jgi:hypothetical protein
VNQNHSFPSDMKLNPVVVSRPGAAIRVEKSELSPRLQRALTAPVECFPPPRLKRR